MTVFEMTMKPSESVGGQNVTKHPPKPLPPPAWLKKANSNDAVFITFRGYMILLVLSYVITSSGAAYGLMAPFYPREVSDFFLTFLLFNWYIHGHCKGREKRINCYSIWSSICHLSSSRIYLFSISRHVGT